MQRPALLAAAPNGGAASTGLDTGAPGLIDLEALAARPADPPIPALADEESLEDLGARYEDALSRAARQPLDTPPAPQEPVSGPPGLPNASGAVPGYTDALGAVERVHGETLYAIRNLTDPAPALPSGS